MVGRDVDGLFVEGVVAEGRLAGGAVAGGRVAVGLLVEGDVVAGRGVDGAAAGGLAAEGRFVDGVATGGLDAGGRVADGRTVALLLSSVRFDGVREGRCATSPSDMPRSANPNNKEIIYCFFIGVSLSMDFSASRNDYTNVIVADVHFSVKKTIDNGSASAGSSVGGNDIPSRKQNCHARFSKQISQIDMRQFFMLPLCLSALIVAENRPTRGSHVIENSVGNIETYP